MKVRNYPGRAVLEDPELLLDPDATRGRAMELLYEASWRECGVNWTNTSRGSSVARGNSDEEIRQPYAKVISQLEGVLDGDSASPKDYRSPRSSSELTTDSEGSDNSQSNVRSSRTGQGGFLIPRPRLIVPVHTYARRRRTGAPPARRRVPQQEREGNKMNGLPSKRTATSGHC